MGRVEGKIAVVTGGASGIGRSCAERLVEEGAVVVVTDVQQELGEQAAQEISANGGRAGFLPHDVTDEAACVSYVAILNFQVASSVHFVARLSPKFRCHPSPHL